jgi:hypothetical protein
MPIDSPNAAVFGNFVPLSFALWGPVSYSVLHKQKGGSRKMGSKSLSIEFQKWRQAEGIIESALMNRVSKRLELELINVGNPDFQSLIIYNF